MTAAIVMDMSYASGDHRTALFGLAIILFLISMSFVRARCGSSRGSAERRGRRWT